MSYNKPSDKPEIKQRVAQLEQMNQLAFGAIDELGGQLHWILTILKDVPQWNEAIENAKAAVEKAKKLGDEAKKANASEVEVVDPEVVEPGKEEKKGLDL